MTIKKILVIEDNELNMKLVRGLLSLEDYTMLEANDAETGIQMAIKHHPDLILMDIQLPGIDGLEATKILHDKVEMKDTPIVALTSYAMQGDEEKAKMAGCVDYIAKPLDTRSFPDTIRKALTNNGVQDGDN